MALIGFATVVVAYMACWFVSSTRILRSDEPETTMAVYDRALSKLGPVVGVYAVWEFGVRFSHVVAVVTFVTETVQQAT